MRRPTCTALADRCCRRGRSQRSQPGFTLVEVLVAMSVLVLLIVLLAQLTSSAGTSVTLTGKQIDADTAARLVFDRMSQDFARMLCRADVDSYFARFDGTSGTNDTMAFLAQGRGYYINGQNGAAPPSQSVRSPIFLVAYRVQITTASGTSAATCELDRLAKGLWREPQSSNSTDLDVPFIPVTLVTADTTAGNSARWPQLFNTGTSTDGDFQILSDTVFRIEFYYLLRDGTYSVKPVLAPTAYKNTLTAARAPIASDDSTQGFAVGSRWYDATNQKGYRCTSSASGAAIWQMAFPGDVAAVIVALALADNTNHTISDYTTLTACLPDAAVSGTYDITQHDLSYYWSRIVNQQDTSVAFPPPGVPAAVGKQIRIYQRAFYLNPAP